MATLPASCALAVDNLGKCYRISKTPWLQAIGQELRGMLRVVGVKSPPKTKRVLEIWALKDVSFSVEPGVVLGVIGANGAGKTTLLKVLSRVSPPTAGRAVGRGRVVSLLELGAGFQKDLTGRENVLLNSALYGIPRAEALRRMADIADFAELGDFIDLPVRTYSSGMYLRLAFSMAINMGPDILLADEVLAVGDIKFQERSLERVREASRTGVTVLFVSHDMATIKRLCDRVMWLNAGRIVEIGDPHEVVDRYQSSAWMLGGKRSDGRGSHSNEYGTILGVHVLASDGTQIGAVRVADDVAIEITLELTRVGISVRCGLDLITAGVNVFRAVQPHEMTVTEPGIRRVTARIPAHLLAERIYTVDIDVEIVTGREVCHLAETNALTFPVFDTAEATSARGTYKGGFTLLRPKLEWSVTRGHDAARSAAQILPT